jgi:hypothetical protein
MIEFGVHLDLWDNAYAESNNVPTPANHHERDRVKKLTMKFLRTFTNRYLRDDPVTDLDRDKMGIHNSDPNPTPLPDPTSRPLLYDLEAMGGFVVRFHFHDEHVEKSQAIPYGMNGCLVNFHVGPEKVAELALLEQTQLFTASPARMQFDQSADGHWLSMSPRWQLDKDGIKGPPGPIEYVRII